jgi:hypothetical protein
MFGIGNFDILRRGFVVGALLLLAGCMGAPPHALAPSDFQKYRIADVSVEGVEVIRSWPTQEEIFVKSGGADADTVNRLHTEPASNFPAVRAHFHRALTERFRQELNAQVRPIFTGSRPVKAVVRLKTFDIPSGARRVLVDQDAKIKAEIDLVDPATGATIVKYDGPFRTKWMVGGVATVIAVALETSDMGYTLITDYVADYRDWLLQRS